MNDSHNSSSPVRIATLKPKERVQCKICMQWLSNHCLKRHVLTHTDQKKHKCDVCSMMFHRKDQLVKHNMVHNKVHNMVHNNERTHKCDVCSKLFCTKHTLLEHKITHTDERKYKCDVCSKLFRTKSALCYHVKTHSDVKMHKCDVCLKKFLSTNNFLIHKMIHSNLKQFELFNHKQTGEKKYKCDVCSKLFSKSLTLVRHKITHTGEKNYKCDVCLKSFGRKFTLLSHKTIHTDEKYHKCGVCFKRFRAKSALLTHKMRYCNERKNKAKTFQCFVCEKIFLHKQSMERHLEMHKKFSFKCDNCNKLFISRVELDSHYKVHTKEKLLFCNLCLEFFTENWELRNHIFIKHMHNDIETGITVQTYKDHVSFHEAKNKCHEESIVKSCSVALKPLYIENNMVYGTIATKPSTSADDVAPNEVKTELTESPSSDSKPLNVSIIYNEDDVEDEIFETNSCITNSAINEVKQENQTIKSENFDDVKHICDENLDVFWNIVGKISDCVDKTKLEINDDINLNNHEVD